MCAKKREYDEEELFAHTRMSLGDHIEELRFYMWRAIKGFIVAILLGFFVARPVLDFLIAPLHRVLRDMRVDQLKKDQNESKANEKNAANNVRVKKEDVAEALRSQESNGDDMVTLTLRTSGDAEIRQQVRTADVIAAREQAQLKTGGEWVTLPFVFGKEVDRTYRIRKGELARALNLPEPKDPDTLVSLRFYLDRDEEVKRQVKKSDLKAAADDKGDAWITFTPFTRDDDDFERQIKQAENEKASHAVVALSITEPFMIWFKVALYAGFVMAAPWIFYQLWMFVAAGLYPHEKRYVHVFLPMSIGLFIAGVCLCQFVVLPLGIRWLLEFSEWVGVRPDLRLSEWFTFALLVPLIFGLAFQLPLVMFGLERIGFFDIDTYRSKRRIAIFLIFLVSGLANASPDPISMTMLAVPLCLLYELGILLCKVWPKPELDLDVEESEEMVEV
jgi:sec-independent protein translocase protein TatC